MEFRKLIPSDYSAYEAIRKEALEKEPEAFGASEETEADIRKERFSTTMESKVNFILGAFDEEKLIAICGFVQFKSPKVNHKGMIWGVYVTPDRRFQKVGKELLTRTLEIIWKNEAIQVIQLGVAMNNFPAINLYANKGFESYGVEKRALRINGKYVDEFLMAIMRPGTEEEENP